MGIFLFVLPLSGSTNIELPNKLRNSRKGLINNKNNDSKCFLWCHIRCLNPLKLHLERLRVVNDLDYEDIKFPVSEKNYSKIKQNNKICINLFCYENDLTYPFYISNQKFEKCTGLLLITEENKSHYVYLKDFSRFMSNKAKNK